jgi:hypothetical protein
MEFSFAQWQGTETTPWKVVACSIRGSSHQEDGLPCQDRFSFRISGERLVAVLSDGAGSAAASDIGASNTVEYMVEQLSLIALDPVQDPLETWKLQIEAAIEGLRDRLGWIAKTDGWNSDLSDFHATLVAVVATPNGGLFAHIGDGTGQATGAPAIDQANNVLSPVAASLPENGEEANATFFVTLPFWKETLRLTAFGPSRRVVLMTDGPMPFAATKGGVSLEPAFMAPVDAYLMANSAEDGAEALAETLSSPKASRVSADDKTLLWAAVMQVR